MNAESLIKFYNDKIALLEEMEEVLAQSRELFEQFRGRRHIKEIQEIEDELGGCPE